MHYLKNIFDRDTITNLRLANGGNAHIQILIKKNVNGEYDVIISDTTALHIDLLANITEGLSDINIQKAKTAIVDNIELQFDDKVHRLFPVIMSKYYKDTTEFKEFFPFGLTEYNKIPREQFANISGRFLGTLTTYQGGVITAQMVTDVTAIRNNFIAARNLQEVKKSDVKTDRLEGNVARVPFQNQLYKNFHTLAAKFSDHPELVEEYFDMKLFFPKSQHGTEPYTVTVLAGKTADSGLTNIVGKTARFKAIQGPVMIYTVPDLNHLDPVDSQRAFIMQTDDEAEKLISDIGGLNDPYLVIRNLSDLTEAVVEIEWVD